jgi:hypothetical protein
MQAIINSRLLHLDKSVAQHAKRLHSGRDLRDQMRAANAYMKQGRMWIVDPNHFQQGDAGALRFPPVGGISTLVY